MLFFFLKILKENRKNVMYNFQIWEKCNIKEERHWLLCLQLGFSFRLYSCYRQKQGEKEQMNSQSNNMVYVGFYFSHPDITTMHPSPKSYCAKKKAHLQKVNSKNSFSVSNKMFFLSFLSSRQLQNFRFWDKHAGTQKTSHSCWALINL